LAKKPGNGGIHEIEKKIKIKDNDCNLLTLNNKIKLEKKKNRKYLIKRAFCNSSKIFDFKRK